MGKSQKKKATRRHNPVRVPDSHLPRGLASAVSVSSKSEAILPIIQKVNIKACTLLSIPYPLHQLASVDASERIWACAAVSNLIQNDPSTRRLLQGKNVVGALITRLSDAVEEVVVEAAGALRYGTVAFPSISPYVFSAPNSITFSLFDVAHGPFRNLCIDGGYDICAEMYNKNILAPLRTFPPKVTLPFYDFLTKADQGSAEDFSYSSAAT